MHCAWSTQCCSACKIQLAAASRKHCLPFILTDASLSAQPERIKHLLDNMELGTGKASIAEKTEGMKYILAVSTMSALRAGTAVFTASTCAITNHTSIFRSCSPWLAAGMSLSSTPT